MVRTTPGSSWRAFLPSAGNGQLAADESSEFVQDFTYVGKLPPATEITAVKARPIIQPLAGA